MDGEQLDRVLMNLLSDAVKFTPGGGRVTVRADARDGEATLSASDTGIGVPAAEQEKLFQRFFRASNANDAAIPGTGLGLTIVRSIVANHGGEMEVRSEEGRGTTITARLAIAATDSAPDAPERRCRGRRFKRCSQSHLPRPVVVDDALHLGRSQHLILEVIHAVVRAR